MVNQQREELMEVRRVEAKAEGEGNALRTPPPNCSSRPDRAEARLAEARRPWWRRLL